MAHRTIVSVHVANPGLRFEFGLQELHFGVKVAEDDPLRADLRELEDLFELRSRSYPVRAIVDIPRHRLLSRFNVNLRVDAQLSEAHEELEAHQSLASAHAVSFNRLPALHDGTRHADVELVFVRSHERERDGLDDGLRGRIRNRGTEVVH